MKTHFRIGIMGGMGPEAGILLQSLIINETPAEKDQDHLEVFTYTNPHVPDRTQSLKEDGGESYLNAVTESLNLLESVGVDILVIACNTAHARISEIQESVKTPILNIVELAKSEIIKTNGVVGILATDGTLKSCLFTISENPKKTITPNEKLQIEVMNVIHDIKKGLKDGSVEKRLQKVINSMMESGCKKFVLGCTELSIYNKELSNLFGDIFIDPMVLAAKKLVKMGK